MRTLLFCAVAAVLGGLVLAGCQETRTRGYQRPLPPGPRRIPPPPPDVRVDAIVLNVAITPIDTNGNGYPDLIYATAHLFDRRYPPSIREEGGFVFVLYAGGQVGLPDVDPIRTWRIEGEALRRTYFRSGFGQAYSFNLSLREGGTDRLPIAVGDLVCRFEPSDGRDPVYVGAVSSIQLGRRVVVPQLNWKEEEVPSAAASAAGE